MTASNPPGAGTPAKPAQDGSIKETLISLAISFVMALVFRSYVVEAFVIPTGSMAPTLLGAHMEFRSPESGFQWAVNPWYAVNDTPVDRWKPYLKSSLINGFAPYLHKPLVDAEFDFRPTLNVLLTDGEDVVKHAATIGLRYALHTPHRERGHRGQQVARLAERCQPQRSVGAHPGRLALDF